MSNLIQLKKRFNERGIWLSVAESVTAGNLQSRIARVSGASTFFAGGITAYNITQKVRHLGIDESHASSVNCVSERVAREMAEGARQLFRTEVALATTGYAEPAPDLGVPAPFMFYAIHSAKLDQASRTVASGRIEGAGLKRVEAQTRFAEQLLAVLMDHLDEL